AMWLAAEQRAGRPHLRPRILGTLPDLRTPEMTQRLVEAFGIRPYDVYGCTEGLFGSECEHHHGIHLFEDTTLVENVDPDGQPVPDGQPGARLLVTNLYNLVQPLLRLGGTAPVPPPPPPRPPARTRRRPGRRPPSALRPAPPRPPGRRVPGRPGRPGPAHPHRPRPRGAS